MKDIFSEYRGNFRAIQERRQPPADWVQKMQTEALDRFMAGGFPTVRQETWRHTPLTALTQTSFLRPALWNGHFSAPVPFLEAKTGVRLVFVDGMFSPAFSTTERLPNGMVVSSLAYLLRTHPERLEPFLRERPGEKNGSKSFLDLNTAFLEDGIFISIGVDVLIERPIEILYLSTMREDRSVSHPRNLLIAQRNSRVTVIERYLGWKDGSRPVDHSYFTNAVTQVEVEAGAVFEHVKIQEEDRRGIHTSFMEVFQRENSHVSSFSFSVGGALVRNEVRVKLEGEVSDVELSGLFLGEGTQHVDHYTLVEHICPRTQSDEFYKGILDQESKGVFLGKIRVLPGAIQTDAEQLNKNLLLSDSAVINTKPQLEILADDVQCTHGATVGQIDSDAVFYLRSRGIEETAARAVLVRAFSEEVLDRIPAPVARERVRRSVSDWLDRRRLS